MEVRKVKKSALVVAVLMFQMAFIPMQAMAQSRGFAITPIVKRGDVVSDGGRFLDCGECIGGVQGFHALNNRGDAVISADVVGGSCFTNLFLVAGGESIRLVDFCHTTDFGRLTFLGTANINNLGQAAINAGITFNNRIVEMLLLYSEGRLTKVVEEGERSPIGTIFKGCGFGQPAINIKGEVAFHACGENDEGFFVGDGVFVYGSGGKRKVVVNNDPSPIGGQFALNFFPAQPVQINDKGEVLFRAGVILEPFIPEKYGLFLATSEGIKKIEVDGERMPGGEVIKEGSFGIGDLNDKGEVAFVVGLAGESDGGIFLNVEGQISKVVVAGDPSPIGGKFSPFDRGASEPFPLPHINDNGSVAFKAFITNGSAPSAIFLASPKAIIKVAAVGDKLPSGGRIREITSFALNDSGQVAFYADVKNGPKGVFLASPLRPQITSVNLKRKSGGLELRVNGSGMIAADTIIEINGVAVTELSYPDSYREDGGTTRRVVSRDARLEQLMAAGQDVQVTVLNPLTNLRSTPVVLAR
jgi:hypothetical protein